MQQPVPPSEEERQLYYYGLPSRPRLVARSSTNTWMRPYTPGTLNMYPKMIEPVGRHRLLHQLWNNARSSLRVQLLEAISAADWTSVDFVRVALNEESHITFMVGVNPGTLSWSDGHAIAVRCKSILEAHNIHEVHCEIREPVFSFRTKEASKPDSTADPMPDSTTYSTTDSTADSTTGPGPEAVL
ncbi:uncharacterized protein TRIVIDRAFT_206574 [Trichoderma virens Gv29-8]|uniref:Uncharacterized protein n=1 Tax=Hypocrea virens (strain Gv29-8 / FGSC 10586) TaxID=413071 RepID=G9NAP4_HYPVG|nr:uncharacterized protein TRIVIDRAFT_206574 [Trichoderma virens Gv29-8]EHK15905.1 hypothetical protein TRIVIDRAFT_206574 [Trichoderma virens Gv29-8]UKZ56327.1 hypothetical protein TrVGV298_010163 [Trichoderma virens]